MKKLYFLSLVLTGLFIVSSGFAQEMIIGGDMESADNWTVVELDGTPTATFGHTDDTPANGSDGCLSMAGDGSWANGAVCQEITIQRGVEYELSMEVKSSIELAETWVEVVIMDKIPATDSEITEFPLSFALNAWDCDDLVSVDGAFIDNNCNTKIENHDPNNGIGDPLDIINIEGEGDTTIVLVLKVGAGQPWNVLFDNVSLMGPGSASVQNTLNNINIFPTQLEGELNIELESEIKDVKILNLLGQTVSSFNNINSKSVTLDVSEISSGIYYVMVSDVNNKIGTAKAIKQ